MTPAYKYTQMFLVRKDGRPQHVLISITFRAYDLEMRWLRRCSTVGMPADFLFDDSWKPIATFDSDDEGVQEVILDDTTITRLADDADVPNNISVFADEVMQHLGDEPTTELEDFIEHFTIDELEEMARLWGWPDEVCAWRDADTLKTMHDMVAWRKRGWACP